MKISQRTKDVAMGAVGGAVALAMVGYSWDFFLTPGEADAMAVQRANQAVGKALAPFCAEKFRRDPDATAKLVELKKLDEWQRANFIEQGGWAHTSAQSTPHSAVSAACAEMLVADNAVKP
jgi:hypothetical protein